MKECSSDGDKPSRRQESVATGKYSYQSVSQQKFGSGRGLTSKHCHRITYTATSHNCTSAVEANEPTGTNKAAAANFLYIPRSKQEDRSYCRTLYSRSSIMTAPSAIENGSSARDGYSSLATWIAHDPDNESYVFRKFGRLSARNLLNLQSQLLDLERRIDTWDDEARRSQDFDLRQSMRRWETFEKFAKDPRRPEYQKAKLDQELKEKIQEYRSSPSKGCTGTRLTCMQKKHSSCKRRSATSSDRVIASSTFFARSFRHLIPSSLGEREDYWMINKTWSHSGLHPTRIPSHVSSVITGRFVEQLSQILATLHSISLRLM